MTEGAYKFLDSIPIELLVYFFIFCIPKKPTFVFLLICTHPKMKMILGLSFDSCYTTQIIKPLIHQIGNMKQYLSIFKSLNSPDKANLEQLWFTLTYLTTGLFKLT